MADRLVAMVTADPQAGMARALVGVVAYMALTLATAGMSPAAAAAVRLVLELAVAVVGVQAAQAVVSTELARAMAPLDQALSGLGSGQAPQLADLSWWTIFTMGGGMFR